MKNVIILLAIFVSQYAVGQIDTHFKIVPGSEEITPIVRGNIFDTPQYVRTDTIKGVVTIMYKDGVRMTIKAEKIVEVFGKTGIASNPVTKDGRISTIARYEWQEFPKTKEIRTETPRFEKIDLTKWYEFKPQNELY